jgi:hypothetical protein
MGGARHQECGGSPLHRYPSRHRCTILDDPQQPPPQSPNSRARYVSEQCWCWRRLPFYVRSLYQLPIWSVVGGRPGPGMASNGGSVPLTPTMDDTAPCQYHHLHLLPTIAIPVLGGWGALGMRTEWGRRRRKQNGHIAGAEDSMDGRDFEAMLLADQEDDERSMQYDDGQYYQHQCGDEDMESEEGFGVHSARVASRSNRRLCPISRNKSS